MSCWLQLVTRTGGAERVALATGCVPRQDRLLSLAITFSHRRYGVAWCGVVIRSMSHFHAYGFALFVA